MINNLSHYIKFYRIIFYYCYKLSFSIDQNMFFFKTKFYVT